MGMQKGFPDLFLAVPRGVYHGAMIEMKSTRKGAKPSPEEEEMLGLLSGQGYFCAVCYGFDSFRKIVPRYLELQAGERL